MSLRWPWPLFRLLHGNPNIANATRRTIASQLMNAQPSELEHTTLKIRKLCSIDIRRVAQTGVLHTGSRLHGILSIIGMHLKLDAGELESLNSQIKSAITQATNAMSLELLSSRVTVRKSLTMEVSGRPTFKNLKALAEKIASNSTLYQGSESELLADSDRWVPPSNLHMPTCSPQQFDPGLRLTTSET